MSNFSTVTTLLGKGEVQGRNELQRKHVERKWHMRNENRLG